MRACVGDTVLGVHEFEMDVCVCIILWIMCLRVRTYAGQFIHIIVQYIWDFNEGELPPIL